VIETQAGDLSAYIPTNVISITDGQIYLEPDLFNAGIRPAVNVGLSVSRVGGDAQTRAMKRVAGRLRLEVAQYNELVSFAQFGTADLDRSTRMQIEKGQRIIEVLKQGQYEPLPLYRQVCILYTVVNDYLADIPLNKIDEFESGLFTYLDSTYPQIGQAIMQSLDLAEDTEELLKRAVQEFKGTFAVA
jgi:F-type H+-transporting ATPase subunit alpha